MSEGLYVQRILAQDLFLFLPGSAVLEPDLDLARPEVELLRQRNLLLL
jgi:hypothetical protein